MFHFGNAQPFNDQIVIQPKNETNKNLDRLEEELNSIEQLKMQYESRNDGRMRTFNTQNSEKSRSLEKKHILKPSQTPFFTRRLETNK